MTSMIAALHVSHQKRYMRHGVDDLTIALAVAAVDSAVLAVTIAIKAVAVAVVICIHTHIIQSIHRMRIC